MWSLRSGRLYSLRKRLTYIFSRFAGFIINNLHSLHNIIIFLWPRGLYSVHLPNITRVLSLTFLNNLLSGLIESFTSLSTINFKVPQSSHIPFYILILRTPRMHNITEIACTQYNTYICVIYILNKFNNKQTYFILNTMIRSTRSEFWSLCRSCYLVTDLNRLLYFDVFLTIV